MRSDRCSEALSSRPRLARITVREASTSSRGNPTATIFGAASDLHDGQARLFEKLMKRTKQITVTERIRVI